MKFKEILFLGGQNMAFTLKIKSKKLFGKTKFDINKLISDSGLKYGSDNEFYILEEGKMKKQTVILYNPLKIGRGIFLDFSKVAEEIIETSYNIPTTKSEILDFIKVVELIEKQFGKVQSGLLFLKRRLINLQQLKT